MIIEGRPNEIHPSGDVKLGKFICRVKADMIDLKALAGATVAVAATRGLSHMFKGSTDWPQSGRVSIDLYQNFKWRTVEIDSKLQYNADSKQPILPHFADSCDPALSFICKAVTESSQEAPNSVGEALLLLTGGVHHSVSLTNESNPNQVWKFLKAMFLGRCPIVVERTGEDRGDKIPVNAPFHLCDLAEVEGEVKLVKLAVTWADLTPLESDLWPGAFSGSDPVWLQRPKLRETLHFHVKAPRGYFWIPLENFIELFSTVTACTFCPPAYFETLTASTQVISPLKSPKVFPGSLPARETLRGLAGAPTTLEACGDPLFASIPQFRLRFKKNQSRAQVEALLVFSGLCEVFSPVTLAVFKSRSARAWKYSETDLIAQTSTKSISESRLVLTIPKFEDEEQVYLVFFQSAIEGSRQLQEIRVRVVAAKADCFRLSRVSPPLVTRVDGAWNSVAEAAGGSSAQGVGWAGNPQFFIDSDHPGKINIEFALTGEDIPADALIGLTVKCAHCELPAIQVSKTALDRVNSRRVSVTSGKITCNPELREFPLQTGDTCIETCDRISPSLLLEGLVKDDFPLVVVPWKSVSGPGGVFHLEIFSDHKLTRVVKETRALSASAFAAWDARTNSGYLSTSKLVPESFTSPIFSLRLNSAEAKSRATFRVSLVRSNKGSSPWPKQTARDPVGCMLGFYIFHTKSAENVMDSGFSAVDCLTKEVSLDTGRDYEVVPATYGPGKAGDFLINVHCLDADYVKETYWHFEQMN